MQTVGLDTLIAERELLDLVARFDDSAIRKDFDSFRNLWTEDSVWEIGPPIPMRAEGRDAIADALAGFHKQNLFFFRLTGRPMITIDGDHAEMRSPTVELAGRAGQRAYANVALYQDVAVRSGDTWRFRYRRYEYLWVDTQSQLSGHMVPMTASAAAAK